MKRAYGFDKNLAHNSPSPQQPRKRTRHEQRPPKLVIFEHEDCSDHNTGEHQEAADRLSACRELLVRLRGATFTSDFAPVAPAAAARVHSAAYLSALETVDAEMQKSRPSSPVRPLSPFLVGAGALLDTTFPGAKPDGMTHVSAGSLRAARRAAGAVVAAIDGVFAHAGKATSHAAFCLVRPPGHHAMVDGWDKVAGGNGFCFLNNVGIGAAHAIAAHGKRVAIVDFDVHHGNGTEEVALKKLAPLGPVLFCSTHVYETFDGKRRATPAQFGAILRNSLAVARDPRPTPRAPSPLSLARRRARPRLLPGVGRDQGGQRRRQRRARRADHAAVDARAPRRAQPRPRGLPSRGADGAVPADHRVQTRPPPLLGGL